ncbi:MAG: DUF922 domain-containing protein [Pseudomonadota bacterium]|jgi:predicted secreted Zn-dependent protease|nr:DUF922 domain-containing protein [Pseudomonadota bacterium]
MGRIRGLLAAGVIVMVAAPDLFAQEPPDLPYIPQVPTTVSITHYPVSGRNLRDVLDDTRFSGPIGYEAEIQYSPNPFFMYEPGPNGCVLTHLEIALDITIRYPEWTDYDRARRSERQRWDARMQVLAVHENVHAVIALYGTSLAFNHAAETPPAADCDTLRELLDARLETGFSRLSDWQRAYDDETNHGELQHEFDFQAFIASLD